jgi:chemotaxis protein methyltransferase WspC
MNLVAFAAELLSRRLGLSLDLLGADVIERALGVVVANVQPENPELVAAQLLEDGSEEWQILVDEIVVPETWFFRHCESFQFLASFVTEKWRPTHPTRAFQVFCIPCASGEEAYSVAITLLGAGLEASRVRIDAADISERLLGHARLALYGNTSFRERPEPSRQEYFVSREEGWQLREEVKRLVRFEKANLLDLSLFRQRAPYDAIFCRNALIYLDQSARHTVVRGMSDLLDDEGLLFTGPSELTHFCEAGYVPMDHAQSFACHKKKPISGLAPMPSPGAVVAASTTRQAARRRGTIAPDANRPPAVSPSPLPPPGIEQAEQLADRGDLDSATAICERLLEGSIKDPKVYSLLGVINESKGALQSAEEFFRKALYLAPDHYESLLHMSLLCERRGDADNAHLYRARAGRVHMRQEGKAAPNDS